MVLKRYFKILLQGSVYLHVCVINIPYYNYTTDKKIKQEVIIWNLK